MKWRKSKENGGKFWPREERSISLASSGELTSTLQLIYSYELVGMLKCSHLTGKLWMLLEGMFGFTMERIGRSGIILVFPMLKTWNYGEEGRLLQHCGHLMPVINSVCTQFWKDFTNLELLGATMNCQGFLY